MDDSNHKKSELRKKAEKILRQRGIKDARLYALDLEQLVEELNIYQIELEHQNNELKTTQENLERNKNLYFDLFDNAPNPYLTINDNYKVENASRAALLFFETDKAHLLNTEFYKFIHPDYQDAFLFFLRKIENSGGDCLPETTELEMRTAENRLRYVRIDGKKCVAGSKKEQNFIISITDLTQKRQSDELLKIRNAALESAANSIVITDIKGTIEWVNEAFTHLTGYSKDEALGKNPRELIKSGKHPKSFFASLWDTINQKRIWRGKVINKRKDGSLYTEEQTISPVLDEKGEIIRFIAVQSDVTEKMIMEQELVNAKEKAEESSRLKSAFLANISHEIRTPMNGILGFAELLQRNGLKEEKREKYINVITQSGHRMLRILNDLIDISKIEAGEIVINTEMFDVDEVISDLYTFFKPQAAKKNLKFTYECSDNESKKIIETDRTKLSQIFANLIGNAIKYTDEGSIRFECTVDNDKLKFSVSDTGIGIPDLVLHKIFDRFGRYESHHSKFREGVGLGLAISKAYADILGGYLDVESNLNEGSVFTFELPMKEGVVYRLPGSGQGKPSNIMQFESQVVLIAEDDDDNYMYMEELLSETNLTLLRAENGKEAINLVKQHPGIKLILMDVRMPEMDGLEACRKIKKLNPKLPVIIQTAYAFSDDKDKAYASGCDDFISKPLEQSTLFSKMNMLIK